MGITFPVCRGQDKDKMHNTGVLMSSNVALRPSLVRFDESGSAVFADGSTADVDAVLLCTGYYYDYPFLAGTERDNTTHTDGAFVDNLYMCVGTGVDGAAHWRVWLMCVLGHGGDWLATGVGGLLIGWYGGFANRQAVRATFH
jgi:hypothetical protein